MANDGSVTIGMGIDENEFKDSLNKAEKTAEEAAKSISDNIADIFASLSESAAKVDFSNFESLDAAITANEQSLQKLIEGLDAVGIAYSKTDYSAGFSTEAISNIENLTDAQRSYVDQIAATQERTETLRDSLIKSSGEFTRQAETVEGLAENNQKLERTVTASSNKMLEQAKAIESLAGETENLIRARAKAVNEDAASGIAPDPEFIQSAVRELRSLNPVIDELQEHYNEVSRAAKNLFDTFNGSQTQEEIDAYQGLNQELELTGSVIADISMARTNYAEAIGTSRTQLEADTKSHQAATQMMETFDAALKESADETARLAQEQAKAEKEAERFAQQQEQASRQTELLQAAIVNYVAQGINAFLQGIQSAIDGTIQYREEIALLETNISQLGLNLGSSSAYLEDFNAVSDNTSQNVAALANLLQSGLRGNNLEAAIQAVTGAVVAFPDQTVQRIGEGIQRTFGEGQAVGNFAELIRRTGGDVDQFNASLDRARTSAERQQVVLDELARTGLADLSESYREMNPELVRATEATNTYNVQLARLGEVFQPAKNSMDEFKNSLLGIAADVAMVNPWLAEFVYYAFEIGRVILVAVTAIALFQKTFGGLGGIFSSTTKTATEAAEGLANVGNVAQTAGGTASSAATNFLSVALGITAIAIGVAVALSSINDLAITLDQSSTGAGELALSIALVTGALAAGIALIAGVASASTAAAPQVIAFGVAISLIAISVTALIEALTELISLINGIPSTGLNVNINQGGGSRSVNGYAKGTASATRGYSWIDEGFNPRLAWFAGGETVLTRAQTNAQRSVSGNISRQQNITYNLGGINVNASTVKSMMDIINIMENEADSYRQGFVGVN